MGVESTGADLSGANISKAILRNADLREASLSEDGLHGAKYDSLTKGPQGFGLSASGAINLDI
jgi:uncharacterized protein YjbI with pentapeptide repeats